MEKRDTQSFTPITDDSNSQNKYNFRAIMVACLTKEEKNALHYCQLRHLSWRRDGWHILEEEPIVWNGSNEELQSLLAYKFEDMKPEDQVKYYDRIQTFEVASSNFEPLMSKKANTRKKGRFLRP